MLICVGYSFYDEHINDIIKQALSIPPVTIIIANFAPTADPESEIEKLKALGDRRIIILDQTVADQSTFVGFVDKIMPDLYEEDEIVYVAETMEKIYPSKKNDQDDEGNDTMTQDKIVESDSNNKQDSDAADDLPF